MTIVDDFAAFYDADGRADLRIDPPAGLYRPDRKGVAAVVAGKSISLRCGNANIPVPGKIHCAHGFCRPPIGQEGQKERKDEHKEFHACEDTKKSATLFRFWLFSPHDKLDFLFCHHIPPVLQSP